MLSKCLLNSGTVDGCPRLFLACFLLTCAPLLLPVCLSLCPQHWPVLFPWNPGPILDTRANQNLLFAFPLTPLHLHEVLYSDCPELISRPLIWALLFYIIWLNPYVWGFGGKPFPHTSLACHLLEGKGCIPFVSPAVLRPGLAFSKCADLNWLPLKVHTPLSRPCGIPVFLRTVLQFWQQSF